MARGLVYKLVEYCDKHTHIFDLKHNVKSINAEHQDLTRKFFQNILILDFVKISNPLAPSDILWEQLDF